MQRRAALHLLVSRGMCTCPMSIEDSAGADARWRMLAHTMHDVSGSLRATWQALAVIVVHPNEWVRGCVQQAQSGHGNVVTSGKPGLDDEPVVQGTGQPGAQRRIGWSRYALGVMGCGKCVPGGGPGLSHEPVVWNGLGVLGRVLATSMTSGRRVR